ncbi:hypothetical protein ACXR2T_10200 [Leucobacter sp. HY1910]
MGRLARRLRAAAGRINGFSLAAAIAWVALAAASYIAAATDPVAGLNGTLLGSAAAVTGFALGGIGRHRRLVLALKPAARWAGAFIGAVVLPMLIATAVQIQLWWLLILPGLAWLATAGASLRWPRTRFTGLHLRLTALGGAVVASFVAVGLAITGPAFGLATQVSLVASVACLAAHGAQTGTALRGVHAISEAVHTVGRASLTIALYIIAGAGPYVVLAYISGAAGVTG